MLSFIGLPKIIGFTDGVVVVLSLYGFDLINHFECCSGVTGLVIGGTKAIFLDPWTKSNTHLFFDTGTSN